MPWSLTGESLKVLSCGAIAWVSRQLSSFSGQQWIRECPEEEAACSMRTWWVSNQTYFNLFTKSSELSLRIHTEFFLVALEYRQHQEPWQSYDVHVQYRWQHLWQRSRETLWALLESLRRLDQKYAWHLLDAQDDESLVWWFLGCYLEGLFDVFLHQTFQVLYLPFLFQSFCESELQYSSLGDTTSKRMRGQRHRPHM